MNILRLFDTGCSAEEIEIVSNVLRSGILVNGDHAPALEQELAAYLGDGGGAVTCASGTDALVMCLEELGCQGGVVIVPAMTFSATYEAVLKARATPYVVDVDEETGSPSFTQINSAVLDIFGSGRVVSAIIVVHLYGWPCMDLDAIAGICAINNIALIEDCAQAFGASLDNRMLGTFGDAAAFSFYPTKPLGGIGDGGAAYFQNPAVAEYARARRNHGRTKDGQMFAGYNSRMEESNAAVLRNRLTRHRGVHDRRRELSGRYHQGGLKKLSIRRSGRGIPYVYPIMVDSREAVRFRLADIGVETRVHYDPALSDLPYVRADCPQARWMAKRVLSLPCHQGMSLEDVDRICDAVRGD